MIQRIFKLASRLVPKPKHADDPRFREAQRQFSVYADTRSWTDIENPNSQSRYFFAYMMVFICIVGYVAFNTPTWLYEAWSLFVKPAWPVTAFTDNFNQFMYTVLAFPVYALLSIVVIVVSCNRAAFAEFVRLSKEEDVEAALETGQQANTQKQQVTQPQQQPVVQKPTPPALRPFTGITLGTATGVLAERDHAPAFRLLQRDLNGNVVARNRAFFSPDDCCMNFCFMGGIGSGKTTKLIHPVLSQLMQQDVGMVIMDVKNNFERSVDYFSKLHGRPYIRVGMDALAINLVEGCTPRAFGDRFRCLLAVSGNKNTGDPFFTNSAVNLSANVYALLQLAHEKPTLAKVSKNLGNSAIELLKDKLQQRFESGNLDGDEILLAQKVMNFFADWESISAELRSSIQKTCEQILEPFALPELQKAFSGETEFKLSDVFNKGAVVLVKIDRKRLGKMDSKFVSTAFKLYWYDTVSERLFRQDFDKDRYCCFLADEFQVFVDPVADTDFWDKSREARHFGVLTMQGVSSLIDAVGSRDTANTIMQNWRQVFALLSSDQNTISMMSELLGDTYVTHENYSDSTNRSKSKSTSTSNQGGSSSSSHSDSEGSSVSFSISREDMFGKNLFRSMTGEQALMMAVLNGEAADDVVELEPLYVPRDFVPEGWQ